MIRLSHRAFTLVEVLIVVVILGILAAIIIPLFNSATEETRRNATFNELQKIRRHIGVYRARHNMLLPSVEEGDGTWGEVIGRDYLLAPPVNAWVGGMNSKRIRFGSGPAASFDDTAGWIYDPATGEIWAGSFDGNDQPIARP